MYTCDKCGKPARIIYQPIGSGGPIDPLDQYGSIYDKDERYCHCTFNTGYGTQEIFEEKIDE
jgi:hypothetical protein